MATLRYLQAAIERHEPRALTGVAGVLACIAAPTLARMALAHLLDHTLIYATYYPAVLIAALLLGWRLGVLVLLMSAVIANYVFVQPEFAFALDSRSIAGSIVFLLTGGVILATAALLREALRRLNAAAARERELNRELQHRVKNNLAVVQGLAQQSIRSTPDPKVFFEQFSGRLVALGTAHDLLSTGNWEQCELPELAEAALEAFAVRGTIHIFGPRGILPAQACVPLVLALHELATNAVKYGALTSPQGQVSLGWSFSPREGACDVVVSWVERDGPTVKPPKRRGLGSRLLSAQPGLDDVVLKFDPQGVSCTITVRGVAPSDAAEPAVEPLLNPSAAPA